MTLTRPQLDVLKELSRLWSNHEFVLIGASAMLSQLPDLDRQTDDLDLCLAVELNEFPAGLETQPGWTRDQKVEHRWYCGELPVDVVPAGPRLLATGTLRWSSGHEMSLTALDLTFQHNVKVQCGPGEFVSVATIPVLALLKMASFCDRPYQRERDLADLGQILSRYLEGDDRCFEDSVFDAGVEYSNVSAYLCGCDISGIATNREHRDLIVRFLTLIGPETAHRAKMFRLGPQSAKDDFETRLEAFRRGLGLEKS